MSRTINLGSGSTIVYPDRRVFAFSPYKCVVTGTSIAQKVTFTFNGKTLIRYTGADSKVTINLTKIFQSFFVGVEFGVVELGKPDYFTNYESNLVKTNKEIVVIVQGVTSGVSLFFDILYGALQQGETEPEDVTIYRFGDLPLTVTQNDGEWVNSNMGLDLLQLNSFGKDLDIQKCYANGRYGFYLFRKTVLAESVNVRIIRVVEKPVCPESYYLRWIDRKESNYKYYNFLLGKNNKASANGATFNHNVLELGDSNGLYKNSLQTLEKVSTEIITVVEPSADYLQQSHIISIFDSPKVWLYMGSNKWMEVNTSESTFEVERNPGKKEIQVNIILPQKYNIRL